jgi:serine/threonine-protein kinase
MDASEPAHSQNGLPETIGRYRIVRSLGQGAMGRVLMAHDPVLDRAVAVKLLRDDLMLPPEQREGLLERMRQEARASARVSHPNIVALHDMGEDPVLGLYLVFEYVEGVTLKERLTRGPLGPEAAAELARGLGDALTTAHAAGVLHRDIKPENLILAKTGGKIADFGIARVPDSTLTRDGGLLGTPAYSAPEAINGGKFSPASDQFSLAATLYEAISGRCAFPGDDAIAVATRISTEEPPRIAEVCGLDRHVDTVLARALSKNPKARFGGADEFGRALAEALLLAPRTQMATLPDSRHQDVTMKHGGEGRGFWLAIGGALFGALVTFVALQLWQFQSREEELPKALPIVDVADAAPPLAAARPAKEPRSRRGSERDEGDEPSVDGGARDASAAATADASVDPARLPAGTEERRDAGTTTVSRDVQKNP